MPGKPNKTAVFHFRLEQELADKVKAEAEKFHVPVAVVIRWALMERYAAQEAEETVAMRRKNGKGVDQRLG